MGSEFWEFMSWCLPKCHLKTWSLPSHSHHPNHPSMQKFLFRSHQKNKWSSSKPLLPPVFPLANYLILLSTSSLMSEGKNGPSKKRRNYWMKGTHFMNDVTVTKRHNPVLDSQGRYRSSGESVVDKGTTKKWQWWQFWHVCQTELAKSTHTPKIWLHRQFLQGFGNSPP